MNSLNKKMAELAANTKQKAEEMKVKAGEAIEKAKTTKEEEQVSDLLEVLSTLFEVDPKAKKPHEMVESLELQGIQTWRGFLLMAEEDIPQLTKTNSSQGQQIPISKNAVRMLTYLKQFTLYNINSGVENAKDPILYTREAFDAYVDDLQLGRKSALSSKDEEERQQQQHKQQQHKTTNKERINNVRASITGFASKLQPGFKSEEGSINDILQKAKTKVFKGKNNNNNNSKDAASVPGDDSSVGAASAPLTEIVPHNDDSAFETMKKNVDDLASKLETTAKNAKTKEEVQKLMVPLLSKLKTSQDKFANMIESRKKKTKKEDAEEESSTSTTPEEATTNGESSSNNNNNNQKFKNLLSSAENATKRAFENAEKVARQAAKKAGILDEPKDNADADAAADAAADNKEPAIVPAQNGCQTEEVV